MAPAAAAAATATTVIRTAEGAEWIASTAARATAALNIRVPVLHRLDHAPMIVAALDPLRIPAPPRAHVYRVTPMKKLKAAARISNHLGFVTARIELLRVKLHARHHYTVLYALANDNRASARLLPHPDRAVFVGIGNRVRRMGAHGRKRGGRPARHFRHLLNGLAAAVARLQRAPVDLLLDPASAV